MQTRIVARWLGWVGLVVGVVLVVAVAAPLSGLVDTGQLLMGLWLLVTGAMLALRRPSPIQRDA